MEQLQPSAYEQAQFNATVRRLGAEPEAFRFWKFAHADRVKVRVFGRGSGAVYDVSSNASWTSLFARDLKQGLFAPTVPNLSPEHLRVLREVAAQWQAGAIERGLELLNGRVAHRFTAVYHFEPDVVRNVALVDKERSLDAFSLQAVPLKDSFCQFVLRDGHFTTCDSGGDPRLAGHPYSGVVASYVGVPVTMDGGALYGTLCHFDFVTRDIEDGEYALLQRAGQILAKYL
jgi:GAF domain-containing protein